ncbi:MAG: hypothetical protein L6Q53_10590 [Candidatus Brocadia sinica]|nr:hypothetical protein [Candidatus Brocadia sinica]NUO06919.1 hypothetical protein [Candidatus Brocadia sinica]
MVEEKLTGKYFLSFEDNKLSLQGRILSQMADDLYLVETYDWFEGQIFDMRLVSLRDMVDCHFYKTGEDMKSHAEVYERKFFSGREVGTQSHGGGC